MAHDTTALPAPVRSRYGFDRGTVTGLVPGRMLVTLGYTGFVRMTRPVPGALPHPLRLGDRVIASWHWDFDNPRPGIPTLLDPQAVEPDRLWHRDVRYLTRYPDNRWQAGKRLELKVMRALRHSGIRTEHATAFEDEMLHVDLWVLMRLALGWDWVPVDVTRIVETRAGRNKRRRARNQGVVPVQVPPELANADRRTLADHVLASIASHLRQFPGQELMGRRAALLREQAHSGSLGR